MKRKKRQDRRAKKLEKAIRLTWDSMESHLAYTHGKSDDLAFHKQCVKDYAKTLLLLARSY